MNPAKTAKLTEMLFGVWTGVVPRNHILDGGAHWLNMANTTEQSVYDGDAALRQLNTARLLAHTSVVDESSNSVSFTYLLYLFYGRPM